MFNLLFKMRYLSLIAVIFSLAGAVLMLYIGGGEVVSAFQVMIIGNVEHQLGNDLPLNELAILKLVEATDAFLFGLVLLIFASGIYVLFICNEGGQSITIPDWMKVSDIGGLKTKLAEVIIVMLFVRFLKEIILDTGLLSYEHLVLPGCAVLLALALKLMHGGPQR